MTNAMDENKKMYHCDIPIDVHKKKFLSALCPSLFQLALAHLLAFDFGLANIVRSVGWSVCVCVRCIVGSSLFFWCVKMFRESHK